MNHMTWCLKCPNLSTTARLKAIEMPHYYLRCSMIHFNYDNPLENAVVKEEEESGKQSPIDSFQVPKECPYLLEMVLEHEHKSL